MRTRLTRISPLDMALFSGFIGFIASIPMVIFAFAAIGPGRTVTLQGAFTLIFTNSLDPVGLVLAYPFLNAIAAVVAGFLTACLYNIYARRFRGIEVHLDQQ